MLFSLFFLHTLAKSMIRGLLVVDPNVRLTVEQAMEHPWMKVDPPVLKEVHQRLSKRASSVNGAAANMKRTDTVLPQTVSSPVNAVRKRGRPPKKDAPEKAPKIDPEVDSQGVPLTGKGSGRRGGPGRGKKGPRNSFLSLETQASEDASVEDDTPGSVVIPERGRQGTKFTKPMPVSKSPEPEVEEKPQGRRSTRNKKTD